MKKVVLIFILIVLTACEVNETIIEIPEQIGTLETEEENEISNTNDNIEPTEQEELDDPVEEKSETIVIDEDDNQNPEIIFSVFLNEYNPASLGKIGVLANWLDPNRTYPFLEGLDVVIFNQYDLFKEFDFDTRIIFYEADLINFYPSQNWGIPTLSMGDIVVDEYQGSKIILARFPAEYAIELIYDIDYRFLSITENSTLDEYFEWQKENPISQAVIPPVDLTESEAAQINNFDLSNIDLRPLDYCKIEQTERFPNDPPQSKGFPLGYNVVDPTGIINIAVVAVDFPDVVGPEFLIEQYANEMPLVEEWSQFMTSGLMEYRIHFSDKWVRAPKDAIWYGCPSCMRVIRGDYSEDAAPRFTTGNRCH